MAAFGEDSKIAKPCQIIFYLFPFLVVFRNKRREYWELFPKSSVFRNKLKGGRLKASIN